jgi:hypothetical protein
MKNLILTGIILLLSFLSYSQQPFNFQAIALDQNGGVMRNTSITLRFSIIAEQSLYTETQTLQTNGNGIFNASIGAGSPTTGNFDAIDWSIPQALKVELLVGSNYIELSSTKIHASPFSNYAVKANETQNLDNVLAKGNDAANRKITNLANPTSAQDAVTRSYADAQDAADGDKNATNEIQDLALNSTTNTLSLTNDATSVDLSAYSQNLDNVLAKGNDAGNRKITNLANPTVAQDAVTKNYADAQDAADGDKNATNEIQDLSLVGSELKITNNATATGINLAPFLGVDTDDQDLVLNTTTNMLSLTDDATPVDLSSYSQNLNNVLAKGNDAGNRKISNLANPTVAQDAVTKSYVDGQDATDGDKNSSNEIQDLSLNAITNSLSLSNDATPVDLSSYSQNLDNVLAKGNDAGNRKISNLANPTVAQDAVTKSYADAQDAADGDKNSANEIQDLSLNTTTNTLSLSNDASAVDLSVYLQNLDNVLAKGNDAGNRQITNVANPTVGQAAATKNYVDSQIGTMAWAKSGNVITNPATEFLGTTNAQPLSFRTNNVARLHISSSGNIGMGPTNPLHKLHLQGSTSQVATSLPSFFSSLFSQGFYSGSLLETSGGTNASQGHSGLVSISNSSGSTDHAITGISSATNTTGNRGLFGYATGGATSNRGVYGVAEGQQSPTGVYGFASGGSTYTKGVYGYADAGGQQNAAGVWGDAVGGTDANIGVRASANGDVAGALNYGVYTRSTGTNSQSIGTYSFSQSVDGAQGSWAVYAQSKSTGSSSSQNVGVFGTADGHLGQNVGVAGLVNSDGAKNNYGMSGEAMGNGDGTSGSQNGVVW